MFYGYNVRKKKDDVTKIGMIMETQGRRKRIRPKMIRIISTVYGNSKTLFHTPKKIFRHITSCLIHIQLDSSLCSVF